MQEFPSILSHRVVLDNLPKTFDENIELTFTGTVKLHGTYAGIVQKNGQVNILSRLRVLSIEKDNEGCCQFCMDRIDTIKEIFNSLSNIIGTENLMISGEYCGHGIQSKVAINKLPRMFVAFSIKNLDTDEFLDFSKYAHIFYYKEQSIYNIYLTPIYKIIIDPTRIDESIFETIDNITDKIDKECPFAALFGINGPGEGIVWICNEKPDIWFKSKGQTHVTRIVYTESKDVRLENLVRPFLTEERMKQGIIYLRDMNYDTNTLKNIAVFSVWICDDIVREEQNILEDSGIQMNDIRKLIRAEACNWYRNKTIILN